MMDYNQYRPVQGTHDNTISTSNSHHIGVRINRDGSSNKQIRGVLLMNPEIDSSSFQLIVNDLVRLLVSLDPLKRMGDLQCPIASYLKPLDWRLYQIRQCIDSG